MSPTPQTLAEALAERLQVTALTNDPGDSPAGLGFVVMDRYPKPEPPGKTTEAFDPSRGNALRRVISVMEADTNPHPAPQPAGYHRSDTMPETYIFVERHANGKAAAHQAYSIIESLLIEPYELVMYGIRMGFETDFKGKLVETDEFAGGNMVMIARWRATGSRRLVPA